MEMVIFTTTTNGHCCFCNFRLVHIIELLTIYLYHWHIFKFRHTQPLLSGHTWQLTVILQCVATWSDFPHQGDGLKAPILSVTPLLKPVSLILCVSLKTVSIYTINSGISVVSLCHVTTHKLILDHQGRRKRGNWGSVSLPTFYCCH